MNHQLKIVTPQADTLSEFERLLSKPINTVAPEADKPNKPKPVNWQRNFQFWRERCAFWLRSGRGRQSDLARHLNVSRQTVWRWFFNPWSKFPGWAAVACNVYYYEQNGREADQALRELQRSGPLAMPRLRRVTPQADKFVPGSEDNEEGEW